MVLVIDSQVAGIAGDMMLCSLVDMGADESRVIAAVMAAQDFLDGVRIKNVSFERVQKGGVKATRLILDVTDETGERSANDIKQCIKMTCGKMGLSAAASDFADSCMRALVDAESKIHGVPADSVRLHEASGFDTAADIIGTAVALEDLGLLDEEVISTPVAVGGGSIKFSHGTTSNPAGAILEIFRGSGITITGSAAGTELTTPTGACMLASLSNCCAEFYPAMSIESVGYGAGSQDFEGFANVLKLVRGTRSGSHLSDTVAVLETNMDDVSGELVGHVIERLMDEGAKDVAVSAAITKKGRPAHLITIICDPALAQGLAETLISETGTLGVRMRTSVRVVAPRTTERVLLRIAGADFEVGYKTNDGTSRLKPEYDDIKRISESVGKPLWEIEELVRKEIEKRAGVK